MDFKKIIRKLGLTALAALISISLMPAVVSAAPLAPTNLAATVQSGPQVRLTWTDTSTNEIGFRVERALAPSANFTNISGLGLPPDSVFFTDSTVAAGNTYTYRVIAFNLDPAPDSPPSNTVTITASVPSAPSGLILTQQAGPPQTVTLSWTDTANNEIGFLIERADDAAFTVNKVVNARVANVVAAPVTFVDADIIPGATYFYRVSALAPLGASAATAPASITLTAAAGMAAGPVVPVAGFGVNSGFPLYYQDTLGNKVRLLPIDPAVRFGEPPTAGNAYSEALNFDLEEFYWMAFMDVNAGGITGLVEFAMEAIFTSPTSNAVPSTEAVMARTRIRLNVPVAGDYTIVTPYGTRDFPGVQIIAGAFDINMTEDIGALPRVFSGANSPIQPQDPALNPFPIDVFLKPVTPPLNPDLYGDGVAVGLVTGGAGGTTVTVNGPGVTTGAMNQWAISGRNLAAAVTPRFNASVNQATTSVQFSDASLGTPTNWLWNFGDGSAASTLQNPAHIYAAGNFIAKLTAANAGGTASASQMVSIFTAPSAVFTVSPGATPTEVIFTSSTQGNPTGWLWNFGDGATSTAQNPTHLYTTTGAKTVTLSIFNPVGTASSSQQIAVGPPDAPTNVTATVASATQINVSWTDNAINETGFRLDRAQDINFTVNPLNRTVATSAGTGLTVTFNDTDNITNNVVYFYRVIALGATANSGPSAVAQAQIGGPPTAQPALTGTLLSATQIKLDWTDPNTNEDFQHLHRAPTAAFVPADITHIILPPNTITFTDTVVAGQTFFYFVHAMNALGDGPNSNIVEISTTVPAAPATLSAAVASPTSVVLNWAAGTSASGYIIQRSVGSGNVTFTQIGTVGNVLTFTDSTVTAPNIFNYQVVATNIIGNSATASPLAVADMTAPSAPALNAGVAQVNGTIDLSWNNVLNEQGYRIMRALSGGALTQLALVNANVITYTDNAAAPSTSYDYQIVAFNGIGDSVPPSNTVSVTSLAPSGPPSAPTGLAAPSVAATSVQLTWTDTATNEAGFRVERAAGTANFTAITTLTLNSSTYTDTTVAPATAYQYQVFAFNTSGNSTPAGPITVTTSILQSTGGGGGGGGGGGPTTTSVSLSGITGSGLAVNSSGATTASAILNTTDGKAAIGIAAGTVMHTESGARLTTMTATAVEPPAQPPQGAVIINYNFGPDGATFDPALDITITYADSDIPAGANEADLYAAFWDGSQWVKLESAVNTETNTITAKVAHFTNIAVLSAPAPAPVAPAPAPVTSSPTPTPVASAPAPAPTVSIVLPADGAALDSGDVRVMVQVNNFELVAPGGANAEGKGHLHYYLDTEIPTAPGVPAISAPGTYKADPGTSVIWESLSVGSHTLSVQLVNSDHSPLSPPVTASVTVTVRQAPAPPVTETPTTPAPTQPQPPTTNWGLIAIIGAAAVVVLVTLIFLMKRARVRV